MKKQTGKNRFSIELSWVILGSIVAYFITTDIYTPSMPSIAREFDLSEDIVQLSMVFFMMGSFVSTILSGGLAENFGRRRLVVGGQCLALLSAIFCALAPNIYILLGARFFMGLGGVVTLVLGFSTVQDVYSPKESMRIFTLMGSAFAIVPAIAPILGGYLDVWFGWRATFLVIFVLLLSSLIVSYFFFKLPVGKDQRASSTFLEIFKKYQGVLKSKKFLRYSLMNSILISGEWFFITILPFYFIQVIEVSSSLYGYYLGGILLCYGLGSSIAKISTETLGYDQTLVLSMLITLLAGVGLMLLHFLAPKNPFLLACCIGMCFMGQGVSFSPSITKTLESFGKMRASASSVRSSLNALWAMIGTVAASFLNDVTLMPMALYTILLSLIGLYMFRFLRVRA